MCVCVCVCVKIKTWYTVSRFQFVLNIDYNDDEYSKSNTDYDNSDCVRRSRRRSRILLCVVRRYLFLFLLQFQ